MTWLDLYNEESKKEYFKDLMAFIDSEYESKSVLPPKCDIYNALKFTPLENVKIVIIGQDPYPTKGVAMGLAFSVHEGIKVPKSLVNIYKELNNELGLDIPNTGDLSSIAKKGVLFLNRILTTVEGEPLAHKNKGWEKFTDAILNAVESENRKIAYILLGNEAKKMQCQITNPLHKAFCAAHPSPLGAYKGFFNSNVFKDAIEYVGVSKEIFEVDYEK